MVVKIDTELSGRDVDGEGIVQLREADYTQIIQSFLGWYKIFKNITLVQQETFEDLQVGEWYSLILGFKSYPFTVFRMDQREWEYKAMRFIRDPYLYSF